MRKKTDQGFKLRKNVLFLLQGNVRKPCNVTPDTSLPDVT